MKTSAIAAILLFLAIPLSSCGNTANGLAKDGRESSHALDDATHRIFSAGAKK